MKHKLLCLLLPALLLPSLAQSHEVESHYDRIHLSASAQTRIDNDTLIASLYAEEEGSSPEKLADIVNRKIQWAVARVKQHPQVRLQTSAYSTSPVYQQNRVKAWRVRQSIRLESQDMAGAGELIGELQDQLALQNMSFSISPELKTRTDDALIDQALAAFQQRAHKVSQQLGRRAYRIVDVDIATSGNEPPLQRFGVRTMAMEASSAPAVEAGDQLVQVSVTGSIELE